MFKYKISTGVKGVLFVITAAMVKELREATGAGMMDCKNALVEAKGKKDKALTILREKGLAEAAKKASRVASSGLVASYIHLGGKIGVLVEVNCETDFVAKTDDFQGLVKNICLHITATNPSYLDRENVPEEIIAKEKEILKNQALREGKPEKIVEKIVKGRMDKYFKENCLLEQPYIKDEDKTIGELLNESISLLGENIVIRRFARFQLGEGLDGEQAGKS